MGRIYLAGKLKGAESAFTELSTELEDRGHEITFKWWDPKVPELPTPYLDHTETSAAAAIAMREAVVSADTAVILFPTPKILGAAIEFGIALESQVDQPSREIIVVGNPEIERQSVFYADPAVIVLKSIAGIRDRAWY